MLRDAAITRIRRGLGYDDRVDVNLIIDALKDAQTEVENRSNLPWFLQTEVSTISTTIDEERVVLPTDFLGEVEDEHLYVFDSTQTQPWIPLCKADADVLRTSFTATARPKFYSITDEYFRLFPTPDAVYTLKMVYLQKALSLDSNIENKWLKFSPYLLIGLAGAFISAQRFNDRAKAVFEQMVTLADTKLDALNESRKHVNRKYQMGGED